MAFLKLALRLATVPVDAGATGAEQAVPGVTVMFAFLLVSRVGNDLLPRPRLAHLGALAC